MEVVVDVQDQDVRMMEFALTLARKAASIDEVPVGCVLSLAGEVIATGHNETVSRRDPRAHAEQVALSKALKLQGDAYLSGVTAYVTLEPCAMCAGAFLLTRVDRIVFGSPDPKGGACGSLMNLCCDPRLNHEMEVTSRILSEECGALLTMFFRERR